MNLLLLLSLNKIIKTHYISRNWSSLVGWCPWLIFCRVSKDLVSSTGTYWGVGVKLRGECTPGEHWCPLSPFVTCRLITMSGYVFQVWSPVRCSSKGPELSWNMSLADTSLPNLVLNYSSWTKVRRYPRAHWWQKPAGPSQLQQQQTVHTFCYNFSLFLFQTTLPIMPL